MRGNLSFKIIVMLQIVFAFALTLTAFLNYYKFEKTITNIVSSRFNVVVNGLQGDLEGALNLGFSLNELRDLQQLIEREKSRDSLITSIDVVGEDGQILASTTSSLVGTSQPEDWTKIMLRSDQRAWRSALDEELVAGITLRNSYGRIAGGVTLRYDRQSILALTSMVRPDLLIAGLIALVACSVATILGVSVSFRRILQRFRQEEQVIGARLNGGAIPIQEANDGLAADLTEIATGIADARRQMAALTQPGIPAEGIR